MNQTEFLASSTNKKAEKIVPFQQKADLIAMDEVRKNYRQPQIADRSNVTSTS